jgi:hypothetical protein
MECLSTEDEQVVAAVNENTALLPLSSQRRRQEKEDVSINNNNNNNNNGVVTVKSKTPKESSFDNDHKSETGKKIVGDRKHDMNSGESADQSSSSVGKITTTTKKKKKKKKGVILDETSAFSLEQQVQMNMMKNELAWQFLSGRQFWLFTIPQAIFTMLSSILAFMATSKLFDEKTKIIINTIVGCTSAIVVFLQTMSGVCDYGTRAAMHDSVSLLF